MNKLYMQRTIDNLYRLIIPREIVGQLATKNINYQVDFCNSLIITVNENGNKKIDNFNRVAIPHPMARRLGLNPRDLVNMDFYEDKIVIWRVEWCVKSVKD